MGNKLEYREQLKAILMDCGVKGEPCVLLLVTKCDQEQEDVLHDLHELVVCGEVHGLFNIDEVENIVSQMTDSKTAPTKCWKSFTKVGVTCTLCTLYNQLCVHSLALCREYNTICTLCSAVVLQVRSWKDCAALTRASSFIQLLMCTMTGLQKPCTKLH